MVLLWCVLYIFLSIFLPEIMLRPSILGVVSGSEFCLVSALRKEWAREHCAFFIFFFNISFSFLYMWENIEKPVIFTQGLCTVCFYYFPINANAKFFISPANCPIVWAVSNRNVKGSSNSCLYQNPYFFFFV